MDVRIVDLTKEFGSSAVLDRISLNISSGELVGLLGPSGSGKTTLLRLIAGLEQPTHGMIFFGEVDASRYSAGERHVGFVFQHYALFRHMNVADNIAFGLRVRPRATRPAAVDIRRCVMELIDLVQLSGMDNRYPDQLSGGQRQRVALARALAINPQILLLDEPFGALDARVRRELRYWLREMHDKTGHTTVFVTHDQEEALEMSDRVVVMNKGRIEQIGTADEIYEEPGAPFVYDFIGESGSLSVEIKGRRLIYGGVPIGLDCDSGDGAAKFCFRLHDVELLAQSEPGLRGRVLSSQRIGGTRHCTLQLDTGERIAIELPREYPAELNQPITFRPRFWKIF